jgi:hypothetical protein
MTFFLHFGSKERARVQRGPALNVESVLLNN